MANVTPGGIEAVMLTSEIRYGDRFSRSDAVGHLLERGRLDDEVGQDAGVDPLDDGRDAAACRAQRRSAPDWPSLSCVSGSAAVCVTMPAACCACSGSGLGGLPGALDEAHVAESSERMGR